MAPGLSFLTGLGPFGSFAGAIACTVAAFWVFSNGDKDRSDRLAALLAIAFTGIWCVVSAVFDPADTSVRYAEIGRNISWILLIFRLFANDGRDESMGSVRPVIIALAFVELLQLPLLLVQIEYARTPVLTALTFEISAMLRMMAAIGALVLLHNLYVGATANSRVLLRWSSTALAVVWGYELNIYTIAYLGGFVPDLLWALRGFLAIGLALSLAVGSTAESAGLQFSPSRAVTFRSLSLLVIGAYLLLMVVITQSLTIVGGDLARLTQVSFFMLASVGAIIWLPSPRLRDWLKHKVTKHLFQHRYDYREEWLRFTRTIGQRGSQQNSLHERLIKAMTDITDSPGGLLLAPDEEANLSLVARWQWPSADVPTVAGTYALAGYLEQQGRILDLDQIRADESHLGGEAHVPQWLTELEDGWALVPLLHFDRLVGAVVLARPKIGRRLDWEDLDLLRVVGQQLASYLAEQAVQRTLMEASRFDEFSRRIAFVIHDVKNLASQLSLLARNAEKHADNPEFRADMLVTLRNSADKLNTLLARLGRYGTGQVAQLQPIDLKDVASGLEARFRGLHPVAVTSAEACEVSANAEALDQSLSHILQNAIDASADNVAVHISVARDGVCGRIDIIDHGAGMAPGFVRNGLFKPFVSSKTTGFGIGAFEARELIRAMGGRLEVDSREGLGTRFSAFLPLTAALAIADTGNANQTEVSK
ncbi:MAG: histidine kinase [Erythrobacter sp. RIFCSPHIGHO2_12_FULL_63_10]|nr:MAG: histidine kinase [Erythrobacter sp. RIFCSPHIGHO2_12_FULL_63_10]